jgi:hypothetical protein
VQSDEGLQFLCYVYRLFPESIDDIFLAISECRDSAEGLFYNLVNNLLIYSSIENLFTPLMTLITKHPQRIKQLGLSAWICKPGMQSNSPSLEQSSTTQGLPPFATWIVQLIDYPHRMALPLCTELLLRCTSLFDLNTLSQIVYNLSIIETIDTSPLKSELITQLCAKLANYTKNDIISALPQDTASRETDSPDFCSRPSVTPLSMFKSVTPSPETVPSTSPDNLPSTSPSL